MIRGFVLAVVALGFSSGASIAGSEYKPATGSFDWTGFYIGGHVGHGWADNDVATTALQNGVPAAPTSNNSFSSDGWLGGAQAGFNWQSGSWVLGAEVDYSTAGIDGSFNYDPATGPQKLAGGEIDWTASVRGRLGYTFDQILVYGTAGIAFAEFEGFVDNFWNNTNPLDHAASGSTETGWTLGAGIEVALSENISVKGEYLYMTFDDVSARMRSPVFPAGWQLDAKNDVDLHSARIGINFRLPPH